MAIRFLNIILALALTFALSFLQGCGSAAPAPAPTPSASTTATTTTTTTTTTETNAPPGPKPKPAGAMMGIAYGPVPMKEAGAVPNDDFFCDDTAPLWSSSGRGDLQIMKELGANAVRLYGNDPRYPHGKFLDEAAGLGMQVIAGMSDYPYTQGSGPRCVYKNDGNCYQAIKDQYLAMLQTGGFLDSQTKEYHSSLQQVILINEPELKIPTNQKGQAAWAKVVISAFDGVLAAEKAAGVTGENLPSFTATFSFGMMKSAKGANCGGMCQFPAVGQMVILHQAMLNPESVGYQAENDLTTGFQQRFVNSFNTQNPSTDMHTMFLYPYQDYFGLKPVFIGEFHKPGWKTSDDLVNLMKIIADTSNPLFGAAFFEFQVRYDKGGSEMEFGMFGLGSKVIGQVPLGDGGQLFDIMCLTEVDDAPSSMTMPRAVANAYGGVGVSANHLCPKTNDLVV